MFDFFKNKKILTAVIIVGMTSIIIICGLLVILSSPDAPSSSQSQPESSSSELPESSSSQESKPSLPSSESSESSQYQPPVSSSGSSYIPPEEYEKYDLPDEMRGVMLRPGIDFLAGELTETAIKSEIDSIITQVKSSDFNSLIVESRFNNFVIYPSSFFSSVIDNFDIMQYIIDKAEQSDLSVFAIYDVLTVAKSSGAVISTSFNISTLDDIRSNIFEFASKYELDGIIFDEYYLPISSGGYISYVNNGAGIGYENYLYDASFSVLKTARAAVLEANTKINIGILADPVWANDTQNTHGSVTSASFTSMYDAFCDVKKYIEQNLFDFISVDCYGSRTDSNISFKNVISWWSSLAIRNSLPLYPVYAADRVDSSVYEGWNNPDELLMQIKETEQLLGRRNGIFRSASVFFNDTSGSSASVINYYKTGESGFSGPSLEVNAPESTTHQTSDAYFTFTGSSDPSYPLTINGQKISRDSSGKFSVKVSLDVGENTFTLKHKDKTMVYKITRFVTVIEQVSPSKNIQINGETRFSVDVWAYEGSVVTATLDGEKITLTPAPADDYYDHTSNYRRYTGTFTAPVAADSSVSLGNIVFSASCYGKSETLLGGSVTVNKKSELPLDLSEAVLVEVISDNAKTFSPYKLGNEASLSSFPLAKGTLDYIVGEEVRYSFANENYTYYLLSSGQLISKNDVKQVDRAVINNTISAMSVVSYDKNTQVTFECSQKAPYNISYSSGSVTVSFFHTSDVPNNMTLDQNPLFFAAVWEGSSLSLPLLTTNGFLGVSAEYDSLGNLVLTFVNPPKSSLSDAVIVIDPGHGKGDSGIAGLLPGFSEQEINQSIAKKLKTILESKGAEVIVIDTQYSAISIEERLNAAQSAKPHILISLHAGASQDPTQKGVTVKYSTPFSLKFASQLSSAVASAIGTDNIGAKQGAFLITSSTEFVSVMLEYGHITNEADYYSLLSDEVQKSVANAICNSINSYLSSVCGSYSSRHGAQFSDNSIVEITNIKFSDKSIVLFSGYSKLLHAEISPSYASDKTLVWSSSDESIATVDQNGKVTAVSPGRVFITAATPDGSVSDSCVVTVRKRALLG